MLLLLLFSNFVYAQTTIRSPLDSLSATYVSDSIASFKKTFPDQEQLILNQLWSKSMGVEDDLLEAKIVERLKKTGFTTKDISYKNEFGITILEITSSSTKEKIEIRNPFTGEFSVNGKVFFISDYQTAKDVYDAIYGSFKKTKLSKKQKTVFSSVSYIVLGLLGTQLDSQECFNDLERAIKDIRVARKECKNTIAEVRRGTRVPASEDYLAKTILLKGIGLAEARDPFCMDFASKISERDAKNYFYSKYSCVNSFRSYCKDVIDLVNCQSEMNQLTAAKNKGSIRLDRDKVKENSVN